MLGAASAGPDEPVENFETPAILVTCASGGTCVTRGRGLVAIKAGLISACKAAGGGQAASDFAGALDEEDTGPHGMVCFLDTLDTLLRLESPELIWPR